MPYTEQLGRSQKSTWVRMKSGNGKLASSIVGLFGVNNEIEISREDLFESAREDSLDVFIAKVIVWGYPRGPRGDNFSKLCSNYNLIKKLVRNAKGGIDDWDDHSKPLNKINGLGMSTYSKLLYFMRVEINGNRALILDQRVISALKKCLFEDLKKIQHIRVGNAKKKYLEYLTHIHKLSKKYNVDSDGIEMFLFQYGTSLKLNNS